MDGIGTNKGGTDPLVAYRTRIIIGIVSILTVTIVLTLFVIAFIMRDRLMRESMQQAQELGRVLHSSLSYLMETRDPDRMQQTLVAIAREDASVARAFILDNRGRIAYSSEPKDIGTTIDRYTDPSCKGCHSGPVVVPRETTTAITVGGRRVQRYVHIIPNDPVCHRCHPASVRINGKLIIDRSLAPTNALVGSVVLIVSGLGALCLAILIPFLWRFLSRGVNKYIREIRTKSAELTVLYGIVERLSATIELEQLKRVIIEIISDAFDADEIDMALPSEYHELGAIVWTKVGNTIERKKVEAGSSLQETIHRWLEGKITDHAVEEGRKVILMPIAKGNNRLAVIVIRSSTARYEAHQLGLVRAMAHHIAIAFENAMLYHMAITDELTGLFSSRHFRQAIEKRYLLFHNYGEKTTLLMVDIDNFKKINDSYGHPAGDAILEEMGKCILRSIRDDDMAFRYGGEEFAILLPASSLSAGRAVAERMRAHIEHHPFRIEGRLLNVTVSIGAAAWPSSADSMKDLIMEADRALYEAKDAGKNRVVIREKEQER